MPVQDGVQFITPLSSAKNPHDDVGSIDFIKLHIKDYNRQVLFIFKFKFNLKYVNP